MMNLRPRGLGLGLVFPTLTMIGVSTPFHVSLSSCNDKKTKYEGIDDDVNKVKKKADMISEQLKPIIQFKNSLANFNFDKELDKVYNAKFDSESVTQHGSGFAVGFFSGFFLKKLSRVTKLIGYFLLTSSALVHLGLVEINYSKLQQEIEAGVNQIKDKKVDNEVAVKTLNDYIHENESKRLGFIVGLVFGLKS